MKNVIIKQDQLDQIQLLIESKNSENKFLRNSLEEMTEQRNFFKAETESSQHKMVYEQLKSAHKLIENMEDNESKMIHEYDELEDKFDICESELAHAKAEIQILTEKLQVCKSYLERCSSDLEIQKGISKKAITMLNEFNLQSTLETADLSKILNMRG